jgi:hypothetical protein
MNHDQIVKQSKQAYNQWSVQWRDHAKQHSVYKMKSFEEFRNTGVGKAALLCANGYSLEQKMDTIKKHAHNVDVIACDKSLGHLLENGIKPKICIVCDANVNYEKYLKPYENQLKDTILFQNVCGNPEWTKNGNWKDKYFYVNKDVMNYQKEFMALSGCQNEVTAGTNVSNMMIVLLMQADNEKKQNLFAYDNMLLIGFDYSWLDDGGYYAYDWDGGGKRYYMRHVYGISNSGKLIYTSNNLSSSASWLKLYVQAYRANVVQCNPHSLQHFNRVGDLEAHMRYRHKPSDSIKVINLLKDRHSLEEKIKKIQNELVNIGRDHWYASRSL